VCPGKPQCVVLRGRISVARLSIGINVDAIWRHAVGRRLRARTRRGGADLMNVHPPKPLLALSVGVIGHRPNRLPDATREKVTVEVLKVLDTVARETRLAFQRHADVFAPERPLLSLVSALAEGADRIAGEAALSTGFMLDVVLPFPAKSYEDDFKTSESQAAFRDLLSRARSILTLPGSREDDPRTYEAGGLTILNQSDILLAIWDGGPSAGRGGTTNILLAAVRAGIPIVHVDAKGENPARVLWSVLRDMPMPVDAIEDLPAVDIDHALPMLVENLVRPPLVPSERAFLSRYFEDRAQNLSLRMELPMLMALLGVRPLRQFDLFPPSPEVLAAEYAAFAAPAKGADPSRLAAAYSWADALGARLAQAFRSAFVLNFAFAALAVVLAASSLFGHQKLLFVVPEIVLIFLVVINTTIGRRRRWHQRWLEARELAERLRAALPLWALGARPTTLFSGQEPTWTGWYARAVIRAQGLRSGFLTAGGLADAREVLKRLLRHQCDYHESNEYRMHQLDRRLERIGFTLFVATLCAAGLYVGLELAMGPLDSNLSADNHELLKHLVIAATAGLPALATATYGIRVIGDFEGIAKRSQRTHVVLNRLIASIDRDPLDLDLLRARAGAAAETMLGDVANWRLAAESRALAIPG
jgi:hypothetical protein